MNKQIAIQMDNIESIDYEFDTSFLIGYVLPKTNCKWINCWSSQRLKYIIVSKIEIKECYEFE